MDEEFVLAKKPVWFLCIKDSETFTISVPKTQHPFRFYRNQPHLVHYTLDIEFFNEHPEFNRLDLPEPEEPQDQEESEPEVLEDSTEQDSESEPEEKEESEPEKKTYSKKELQKMRKSDIREILKELAPEKSSPVRKENIIKEVLKAQGSE